MRIPPVSSSDVREVADALTAAANAAANDPTAAITWIRRAAQVAGQAGDDERALELALAASDLAERFASSGLMPVARKHDDSATTAEIDVSEFCEPRRSRSGDG